MKGKPISEEKKIQIIDFYVKKGYNMIEISEMLKVSRPVVSNVINKYKQENNIDIKLSKVNITEREKQIQSQINIPPKFLRDLNVTNEDRNIIIISNKKERTFTIKKSNKD